MNDHAAAKLRAAANVDDLGDQLLAAVVARMGFAGEDDLHRAVLVVEDRRQTFEVAEDQGAALVGGETAGKTDGQRFGIEHLVGAGDLRRRGAAALQLHMQPVAGEDNQPFASAFVGAPQLRVRDVVDLAPDAVIGRLVRPTDVAKIAVVKRGEIGRHPAAGVHAIGDRSDRDFRFGQVGPNRLPHVARHLAMQLADAVGDVRQANGQHGHAERLVHVARVLPAQAEEVVPVDLELRQIAGEVVLDELRGEHVIARRHRRVRGEASAGGDGFAGGGEIEPVLVHHDPNAFQPAERGVPLVHVAHGRRLAQRPQGPDAADAQHHLLADAHVVIAAVEPGRDLPIVGVVLRNVRVEQIERDAADIDPPDANPHIAARQGDADQQRRCRPAFVSEISGRLKKSFSG